MMGLVAMELHGRLSSMVGACVHAGGGWGRVVVAAAAGWGSDVGLGTASPVLVAGVVVVGVVVAWRGRHLVTIPGRPMSGHGRVSAAGVVEASGAVAAGCMAGWPAHSCGCGHAEPVVASRGEPARRWKTAEAGAGRCQATHAVHPVGPAAPREPAACHRPQPGPRHLSVKRGRRPGVGGRSEKGGRLAVMPVAPQATAKLRLATIPISRVPNHFAQASSPHDKIVW